MEKGPVSRDAEYHRMGRDSGRHGPPLLAPLRACEKGHITSAQPRPVETPTFPELLVQSLNVLPLDKSLSWQDWGWRVKWVHLGFSLTAAAPAGAGWVRKLAFLNILLRFDVQAGLQTNGATRAGNVFQHPARLLRFEGVAIWETRSRR